MEIIPIDYCDVADDYVHLNQTQTECAFEHQCESMDEICPLQSSFHKKVQAEQQDEQAFDMPFYYISDL